MRLEFCVAPLRLRRPLPPSARRPIGWSLWPRRPRIWMILMVSCFSVGVVMMMMLLVLLLAILVVVSFVPPRSTRLQRPQLRLP